MALMAAIVGLGLLFYILFRFRSSHEVKQNFASRTEVKGLV